MLNAIQRNRKSSRRDRARGYLLHDRGRPIYETIASAARAAAIRKVSQ